MPCCECQAVFRPKFREFVILLLKNPTTTGTQWGGRRRMFIKIKVKVVMMCVFKKPELVTWTWKEKKRGKMETWCEIARKNKTGWKTVTDQCAQWGGNGCLIILVWKHLKSQVSLTESRGGVAHRVHIRWSHPCFHVLRPSFETKMWVLNSWFPGEALVLNTVVHYRGVMGEQ